jgi:antitoxin (DNA-binding transcriptional repressor) of toxin-antitoxin stability system
MKTATVHAFSIREVRQSFHQVLQWVGNGEEVLVTSRRKTVAKIVPPTPGTAVTDKPVCPDFMEDQRAIYGERPPRGENAVVAARRQERF